MKNNRRWSSIMGAEVGQVVGWLVFFWIFVGCSSPDVGGMGGAGGFAGAAGANGDGVESANCTAEGCDLPEVKANVRSNDFVLPEPTSATACTSGSQCSTGYCVDGYCCDSKCDNKCMACSSAKKGSGADGICGSIKYDTDPDNDCPYGACDGKNMCKNYNGFSCTAAAQCLSNYCVDGFCCNNICMSSCQACSAAKKGSGQDGICGSIKAATDPDNECSNGDCNGSGACTTSPQPTFPNGTACTSAASCASGYCADGVCCDSWCLGTCQACTAAKKNQGTDGTCGNIANDKDPDEECWGGACNGAGVCKQYNGVPCVDKSQCLSNYCVDGFCCGNICTGWCYACSEARKGGGYDGACGPILSGRDPDNECSPGECNGSGTCNQPQTPLANGSSCIAAGQCASGNCVDGYCCNTACTGACQACSATKKGSGANGTCGNIASATDPDSECGYGGQCGGNGMCRYYNGLPCTAATQCFSNYCADGFCCGNICNQTCHACSAAKKGQGGDGACGPIVANADPDNECGLTCNGAGACTKAANGIVCSSSAECISGYCVDGVCCNTSCVGSCMVCNVPTALGTCTAQCPGACTGTLGFPSAPLTPLPVIGSNFGYATSGDFNADGKPDVAAVDTSARVVSVFMNQGGGTLAAKVDYATGTNPKALAAKDLNGDGKLDLVTLDNSANVASVYLNQGNGTFAAKVDYATGAYPQFLSIADLNADGWPDLVIPAATVLLNQGNGTFVAKTDNGLNTGGSVSTGDLNGDGKLDVVMVSGTSIYVSYNDGHANFTPAARYTNNRYMSQGALADMNGDSKLDVIALNTDYAEYCVWLNDGTGGFTTANNYPMLQSSSLELADLNNDGKMDLVTTGGPSYSPGQTLAVAFGTGTGKFGAYTEYPTRGTVKANAIADITGDGNKDIVAFNTTSMNLLINQGNSTFYLPGQQYIIGENVLQSKMADFNGDGKLDIAMASGPSSAPIVTVLINQGNGNFGARADYGLSAPANSLVTADLTGDGKPEIIAAGGWMGSVTIWRNQGNGTFASRYDYTMPDNPYAIVAADFTGDGRRDLAIGSYTPSFDFSQGSSELRPSINTLSVLVNLGNGIMSDRMDTVLGGMYYAPGRAGGDAMASMDLNGDGKMDLLWAYGDSQAIRIMHGQGNGSFTYVTNYAIPYPAGVSLVDMSGDGLLDLVVEALNVGVFVNQGGGTFGPKVEHAVTGVKLAIADVNGDGQHDFVRTQSDHSVGVALNQGGGTFGALSKYASGGVRPGYVLVHDMNIDNKPDLLVVNTGSGKLTVLLGACLP